jgi:hypothetical protein
MENKSANKLWKESKTTLSFKEWIERENKKKTENQEGNFLPFNSGVPANVIKDSLDAAKQEVQALGGYKSQTKTVFGLNQGVLVISGLLIVGALGYVAYTKLKNKK